MKVYKVLALNYFEAWSGGEETLDRIRDEDKISDFEAILEDLYPDGIDETTLNDLLRFESDTIYGWLGMKTEEELAEEEAEEAEEAEESEALKKAREAIKGYDSVDDLCEYFDGNCDDCPLCRWESECYDIFNALKKKAEGMFNG